MSKSLIRCLSGLHDCQGSAHGGGQKARVLDGDRAEVLQDEVGEGVRGFKDKLLQTVQVLEGRETGTHSFFLVGG